MSGRSSLGRRLGRRSFLGLLGAAAGALALPAGVLDAFRKGAKIGEVRGLGLYLQSLTFAVPVGSSRETVPVRGVLSSRNGRETTLLECRVGSDIVWTRTEFSDPPYVAPGDRLVLYCENKTEAPRVTYGVVFQENSGSVTRRRK